MFKLFNNSQYLIVVFFISLKLVGSDPFLLPTGFCQKPFPSLMTHLEFHEFEKFKALLKNPESNVNQMYGDESLLHTAYTHCFESTGVKFLCELLQRSDLEINQKSRSRDHRLGYDFKGTVLECAVKKVYLLLKFVKYDCVLNRDIHCGLIRQLFVIHVLLAKGANPALMSEEVKCACKESFNINTSQQFGVDIKNELVRLLRDYDVNAYKGQNNSNTKRI